MGMMQGLSRQAQAWTSDAARAGLMAEAVLGRVVGREAATLAFADTYRLMAFLFIAALLIVPFAKPAPVGAPPPADH
jgi:DHA2 family multidrug resistance protein